MNYNFKSHVAFICNILLGTSFLFISMAVQSAESKSAHHLFASHGMVLFQDKQQTLYASHMPLYNSPHNYQIIYKVEVEKEDYIRSILNTGMVTLLPKPFNLMKLINGESFDIEAKLYQGHFERKGTLLSSNTVKFIKPIIVEKIISPVELKNLKRLNDSYFYNIKINKQQTLLLHKIDQPPSFDAIAFVNNSDIQNVTPAGLLKCEIRKVNKPVLIARELNTCAIKNIVYLEVQDFKS